MWRAQFDSIDYSIWAARNYGLRLIIPLTDNYQYCTIPSLQRRLLRTDVCPAFADHGGKFDFLRCVHLASLPRNPANLSRRWAGISTWEPNQFYTSPTVRGSAQSAVSQTLIPFFSQVIKMFKAYIAVILNHVNAYTGVRPLAFFSQSSLTTLSRSPTRTTLRSCVRILAPRSPPLALTNACFAAWETGNELGGYFLGGGAPPAAWTREIAKYIKSLAPNQLIADGTDGLVNSNGALATTAFQVDEVDLV